MNKVRGLTFIEVLLVIIIIGVLIGVAVPNLKKAFNDFQLESASRQLQAFMNYLSQRAIVEGKIIYFNIDNDKKEYWAQVKDIEARLKTYSIPKGVNIEALGEDEVESRRILFKPDGEIDKVTVKLTNTDNREISLTTEGVFGKVKIKTQE